jgi:NADPH-dependent 2,4-dienoyl-CoA reductase/sulfur reductase-like enzyme/rhodanese-related sulfurtransferase
MNKNIVIIGAVSLGPKAAARLKRLQPDARVTMVDQENLVSYSCGGIPMFLSGDISEPEGLITNNFQTLRYEKYYTHVLDVTLLRNTRALKIDRQKKEVLIQSLPNGKQEVLPYDNLVVATGKRPKPFTVPGFDLPGVLDVYSLKNAAAVKERIVKEGVEKAVIIGGGFTSLETAQSLMEMWGIQTTVVEMSDQLLPGYLSLNMAAALRRHVEDKGLIVRTGAKVLRLEGNGSVQRVVTDKGTIETDLVIVATGVEPNSDLAREAGLEVSPGGAIVVNKRMQTSDPLIYAGGDCVEIPNLVTGRPGYFPWPSLAQRQGRVIGTNLAGEKAEFKGAVGNFAAKFFDKSVACAGLNIAAAGREGFDAVNIMVSQLERAHFWPVKDFMFLDLVVEKETGTVLGIQGMADSGDGLVGRINTVAAILESKPTASDIGNLEIAYSPQFSGAMDIVNTLGNYAENVILGKGATINADELQKILHDKDNKDWVVIDARFDHEAEPYVQKNPGIWKNISVTEVLARKDEIPRDKKIILLCKTGERSYDFQVVVNQLGIKENYNLQGGVLFLWRLGVISESGDLGD